MGEIDILVQRCRGRGGSIHLAKSESSMYGKKKKTVIDNKGRNGAGELMKGS